tara:strand:+ start:191 stop:607 length:417 start_codon:yes stop_codon:yes gene_type:complete
VVEPRVEVKGFEAAHLVRTTTSVLAKVSVATALATHAEQQRPSPPPGHKAEDRQYKLLVQDLRQAIRASRIVQYEGECVPHRSLSNQLVSPPWAMLLLIVILFFIVVLVVLVPLVLIRFAVVVCAVVAGAVVTVARRL